MGLWEIISGSWRRDSNLLRRRIRVNRSTWQRIKDLRGRIIARIARIAEERRLERQRIQEKKESERRRRMDIMNLRKEFVRRRNQYISLKCNLEDKRRELDISEAYVWNVGMETREELERQIETLQTQVDEFHAMLYDEHPSLRSELVEIGREIEREEQKERERATRLAEESRALSRKRRCCELQKKKLLLSERVSKAKNLFELIHYSAALLYEEYRYNRAINVSRGR